MRTRFLIAGTVAGGLALMVLGGLTARVLPPRYSQFKDAKAVVETVRANITQNGIYTAPQGLFVAVSLRPDLSNWLQDPGRRLAAQLVVEFAVAFSLCLVLTMTSIRSPLHAAAFLGLIGLAAGTELRFPEWNWMAFPMTHALAGAGYLAANWFLTGLLLGALRRKLQPTGR
jgi:hypothetical protein